MKESETNKKHFFYTDLGVSYGVPEAIVLHHFIYWITSNSMNGRNYHEGRFWTFNPVKKFVEYFPFWSEGQIARRIKSLIKQGVIITGNFNKHSYDQTLWYALNDEEHFLTYYNPVNENKEWKARL